MHEANEIHRDIYVGIVAERMAQSGYYGEDVTVYGFMDKEKGFPHTFADETECSERYLQLLAQGKTLSRIGSVHKRVLLEQIATVMLELDKELRNQVQTRWLAVERRCIPFELIRAYVQSLTEGELQLKKAAIAGIAMVPIFLFSEDDYASLTSLLEYKEVLQGNRCYYGFLAYQEGQWQTVMNGSLPATLEKWLSSMEREKVTPLLRLCINSRQPVYMLKPEFEACLK